MVKTVCRLHKIQNGSKKTVLKWTVMIEIGWSMRTEVVGWNDFKWMVKY